MESIGWRCSLGIQNHRDMSNRQKYRIYWRIQKRVNYLIAGIAGEKSPAIIILIFWRVQKVKYLSNIRWSFQLIPCWNKGFSLIQYFLANNGNEFIEIFYIVKASIIKKYLCNKPNRLDNISCSY